MNYTYKNISLGMLKTVVFLVFVEIIISTLFPLFGIHQFKPTINVLIVLYLAFKLNVSFLPYLILILQYIHGVFSIEGWAIGSLIGVLVALLIRYARDMISFTSGVSTMVVVFIFHLMWNLMFSVFVSIKMGDFGMLFGLFFDYFPEAIFVSLLSPVFYQLFDKFWRLDKNTKEVSL